MGWSEPGFGFFGKGFWGRRMLWDNVPVQQRTLDVNAHLEGFLSVYGDELEAFLASIGQLPLQRDPYLARADQSVGESEWIYVAQALRWTDPVRGEVLRLIEERQEGLLPAAGHTLLTFAAAGYVAAVPGDVGLPVIGVMTGSSGTLIAYNNTLRTWLVLRDGAEDTFDAAEVVKVPDGTGVGTTIAAAPDWCPWFPYAPVSNMARWWRGIIPAVDDATGAEDPAEYEIALVRTRNFDPTAQFDVAHSLGNEVWVQGGDLVLPFQYPAAWVLGTDPLVDYTAGKTGVPIGAGDGGAAPPIAIPGARQRLALNIMPQPTFPIITPSLCTAARLVVDVPIKTGGTLRLYDLPTLTADGEADVGALHREDPLSPGYIEATNPLGLVDYLAGIVTLDLTALGLLTDFDATIRAFWQARGYYVQFRPPRVLDFLARDYGFDNDRNDPEERQRTAIAHVWQYFGCKAAQESYRIRGDISLFNVFVRALWRICTAEIAGELPADHVFEYGGTYYTDLEPRSVRFDDIRGDEQYYDIFNHDPLLSPGWLTLVDRALMFPDDSFADGMSAGLAFGLDVTQGYNCPVSEVDMALPWRTPATLISSTALTEAEALSLGLAAGYRLQVQMMRCQAEAFNFHRGYFGLTEYDQVGLVRPAIDDTVFWIDYEDVPWAVTAPGPTLDRDVGVWTVIVGVGFDAGGLPLPGPTVGSDIAVRYWPEIDKGDCCFCRSYRVRVEIEPKDEAYAYYETEAAMLEAVERLKGKLLDKLVPIHVRVAEWVVTTEFTVFMGGVQAGLTDTRHFDTDEFVGLGASGKVELSIEQRGDLPAPPQRQTMELRDGGGGLLLTVGPSFSGASDADTWYPVAGYEPATPADVTALLAEVPDIAASATGHATVTFGDVRWTFRVTRGTLG